MSATILHKDKHSLSTLSQPDENDFIEIYKTYWSRLYAIAYNRLNSKEAAEDVVQEVMLGLWQRKKEAEIDNLEAWLAAATRYSVFRQLANFGSQKIISISSQPEASYLQDFDSAFINQLLKEQVHQLPEKCKLVFEYSRNYEMSNKEIAAKLDISEKSVEKHITKAIKKLRDKLTKTIVPVFFFHFCIFF